MAFLNYDWVPLFAYILAELWASHRLYFFFANLEICSNIYNALTIKENLILLKTFGVIHRTYLFIININKVVIFVSEIQLLH